MLLLIGATVLATQAVSTRSATGTAAIVAIVLKRVLRVLVVRALIHIATAIVMGSATWAASPRTATGMTAIAAIVLRLVLRLRVAITTGATVNATSAASPRSATGTTEIAAIFLKLVT